MRPTATWALFALLLVLALALGLAAGSGPTSDSPTPSVSNAGAQGLKVLATWLAETGVDVRIGREPLTSIPTDVRTLVVPAPTARPVTAAELSAMIRFAEAGGTLIVFVPRESAQRALTRALHLSTGEPLSPEADGLEDPAGASVTTRVPASLLTGVRRLRLAADTTLKVDDDAAVPVAGPGALWWKQLGAGELWLAAGADLAGNARLDMLDNAVFWANVGRRGPVLFDEPHHLREQEPPLTTNLLATALQFAFCALAFLATRGQRLGPARATADGAQRSALEYVTAMATLTRNAKVDAELIGSLRRDLRLSLRDRLGLPPTLPVEELRRALEHQTGLQPSELTALFESTDVLAVTRALALLEARLDGRAA